MDLPGVDAVGRALIIDRAGDGRLRWRYGWRWRAFVRETAIERRRLKTTAQAALDIGQSTIRKALGALADAIEAARARDAEMKGRTNG